MGEGGERPARYVRIFYSELDRSTGKNNHISPCSFAGVLRRCGLLCGYPLVGYAYSGQDVAHPARAGKNGRVPTLPGIGQNFDIFTRPPPYGRGFADGASIATWVRGVATMATLIIMVTQLTLLPTSLGLGRRTTAFLSIYDGIFYQK